VANDPRRFTIRRPGKAGQMSAQSPDTTGRKGTLLTGDLQRQKVATDAGVVVLDVSSITYNVAAGDDILLASAADATGTLRLPLAADFPGRTVVLNKSDSGLTFNVIVAASADDTFRAAGLVSATGLYLRDANATLVVRSLGTLNAWLAVAMVGDVAFTP
jgi:hypothetical protein